MYSWQRRTLIPNCWAVTASLSPATTCRMIASSSSSVIRAVTLSRPGGVKGTARIQDRSKARARKETTAGMRTSTATVRSAVLGMKAIFRSKTISRSKFSSSVRTSAPCSSTVRT